MQLKGLLTYPNYHKELKENIDLPLICACSSKTLFLLLGFSFSRSTTVSKIFPIFSTLSRPLSIFQFQESYRLKISERLEMPPIFFSSWGHRPRWSFGTNFRRFDPVIDAISLSLSLSLSLSSPLSPPLSLSHTDTHLNERTITCCVV